MTLTSISTLDGGKVEGKKNILPMISNELELLFKNLSKYERHGTNEKFRNITNVI
jgi:hypothetical protein